MKESASRKTSVKVKSPNKSKGQYKAGNYLLRLYITGNSPHSIRAILNIKRICEEYLPGSYDLEIIDICANPEAAKGQQIIAAPTLVRTLPHPLRKLIGDLSNEEKVLYGLDLPARKKARAKTELNEE